MSEFFSQVSTDYLASKLTRSPRTVTDYGSIKSMLFKEICDRRKNDEFTKHYARGLWEEVVYADFDERLEESDLIFAVMGDDWWHCLPTKPNPDYEYLCKIIEVVKDASETVEFHLQHLRRSSNIRALR